MSQQNEQIQPEGNPKSTESQENSSIKEPKPKSPSPSPKKSNPQPQPSELSKNNNLPEQKKDMPKSKQKEKPKAEDNSKLKESYISDLQAKTKSIKHEDLLIENTYIDMNIGDQFIPVKITKIYTTQNENSNQKIFDIVYKNNYDNMSTKCSLNQRVNYFKTNKYQNLDFLINLPVEDTYFDSDDFEYEIIEKDLKDKILNCEGELTIEYLKNKFSTPYSLVQFLNGYIVVLSMEGICRIGREEGFNLLLLTFDVIRKVLNYIYKNADLFPYYYKNKMLHLVSYEFALFSAFDTFLLLLKYILRNNQIISRVFCLISSTNTNFFSETNIYKKYNITKKCNEDKYTGKYDKYSCKGLAVSVDYILTRKQTEFKELSIIEIIINFLYVKDKIVYLFIDNDIRLISELLEDLQDFSFNLLDDNFIIKTPKINKELMDNDMSVYYNTVRNKICDNMKYKLNNLSEFEFKEIKFNHYLLIIISKFVDSINFTFLARIRYFYQNEQNESEEEEEEFQKLYANIRYEKYEIFFIYLVNSLKSQNLEKRINAMNTINELIILRPNQNNANPNSVSLYSDDLIMEKDELLKHLVVNKILNILLGENIHVEILKRSYPVFRFVIQRYYKFYINTKKKENINEFLKEIFDLLWFNYINKYETITAQIEHIICEISTILPIEYSTKVYKKLRELLEHNQSIQKINFIEFVCSYTNCCYKQMPIVSLLMSKNSKNDENEEIKNIKDIDSFMKYENILFGLPLLLLYINDYIPNKDQEKVVNSVNIIDKSSEFVVRILEENENIDYSVCLAVLKLLILNVKNKKNVIQSINLFINIVKKCFPNEDLNIQSNTEEVYYYNIKKAFDRYGCKERKREQIYIYLDNAYDIMSLITQDIVYYLEYRHNFMSGGTDDKKYFSLYDERDNIKSRLRFLFFFTNNDYCIYSLDLKGKEHLLPLYNAFNLYGNEGEEKGMTNNDLLNEFLEEIHKHLKIIDKETSLFFFNEILNNEEFFKVEDINEKAMNLYKDMFIKVNTRKINEAESYYDKMHREFDYEKDEELEEDKENEKEKSEEDKEEEKEEENEENEGEERTKDKDQQKNNENDTKAKEKNLDKEKDNKKDNKKEDKMLTTKDTKTKQASKIKYKKLNVNDTYPLIEDYRGNIYVKNSKILGVSTLYEILQKSSYPKVQREVSNLLSCLCLNLYNYNPSFSSVYWMNYINNLSTLYTNCIKSNNKTGIKGITKLIYKIYLDTSCKGIVPIKANIITPRKPNELYVFTYDKPKPKSYKISISKIDIVYEIRVKLGYFYDLNINEIIFTNKDKSLRINLFYDFYLFCDIFKDSKEGIYIETETDQISKLKNNPKQLIENNDNIKMVLLKLLHDYNSEYVDDIWKIVNRIPPSLLIENKIKELGGEGNEKIITENEIKYLFDIQSTYVLTFTLNNIMNFIKGLSNEDQLVYLKNFICYHKGDEILINTFLNMRKENFILNMNTENNSEVTGKNFIGFECLGLLLQLITKIINLDLIKIEHDDDKAVKEKGCKSLAKISSQITNLICIILDISSKDYEYIQTIENICENKEKNFLIKSLNHNVNDVELIDLENDDDLSDSSEDYNAYKIDHFWKYHSGSIKKLFEFSNLIYKNDDTEKEKENNNYLFSLFKNTDEKNKNDFYNIFIEGYIKLSNIYIKKTLLKYLLTTFLSNKTSNLSMKYFNMVFQDDTLNYINKSSKSGLYFYFISSIFKQCYNLPGNDNENKTTPDLLKVSHQLINYISQEKENENLIEGYLILLKTILSSDSSNKETPENIKKYDTSKIINDIIQTVDIYKILLSDCILSKCQSDSINSQKAKCESESSQLLVYEILSILCNKSPQLFNHIISTLNTFHKIGYWKDSTLGNWKINLRNDKKFKYVGLKNLGCTCYMNSILQILFNIPELRETVLSLEFINNLDEDNPLYQLKLLFSSLKYKQCQYHNPKKFTMSFDNETLNIDEQMDADEFYGKLIDKLENSFTELKTDQQQYKNLFKFLFGGKNVDELLFNECNHKRENESFFNSIPLQVEGKKNIDESLKNYVNAEIMDGSNSIYCEECKKKVPSLKRQSIKLLPRKLVMVLKRFQFDYDTMAKYKLNDYFEFPTELDMYPYTQEFLNKKEDEQKNNIKMMYDLCGVVIHCGTSESGHYYALIKDSYIHDDEQNWYEYNDTYIKHFNIKDLPNEAFGGEEEHSDKNGSEREEKTRNAYILIYNKRNDEFSKDSKICNGFNNQELEDFIYKNVENDQENHLNGGAVDLNCKLIKSINEENYNYWVLKNISSSEYQNFIINLMKLDIYKFIKLEDVAKCRNDNYDLVIDPFTNCGIERKFNASMMNVFTLSKLTGHINKNNQETVGEKNNTLFIFCCVYFYNVILRCKQKDTLFVFTDIIKLYINSDISKAIWIVSEFSNDEALTEYIIECSNNQVQKVVVGIIYCALIKIYKENNSNSYDKIIINYVVSLLNIIDKKINQVDMEYVYYLLYRALSIESLHSSINLSNEQKIITNLLKSIDFREYIIDYFLARKKSEKSIKIPEEFKPTEEPKEKKDEKNTGEHNVLTQKESSEEKLLTSSEESAERKFKERLKNSREDQYLISVLILLSTEEELYNLFLKGNGLFLENGKTKLNSILLSNKLYSYITSIINVSENTETETETKGPTENSTTNEEDAFEKLEKIEDLVVDYLLKNDYDDIDFSLLLFKRFMFKYNTSESLSRLDKCMEIIYEFISKNSRFYFYVLKLTEFMIDIYECYYDKIMTYLADGSCRNHEYYSAIITKLISFYEENDIPPRYTPKLNGVTCYKFRKINYNLKVSAHIVKGFEDSWRTKTKIFIEKLKLMEENEVFYKEKKKYIYDSSDCLIDFKFMPGDKINFAESTANVVKVTDESIYILYTNDENKKNKYEYVDTDEHELSIYMFKEEKN